MDFIDEYYADKDLSLLKKLTLVIPTYNRNYYLSRCLWYHAHFPFGEIIVADSSPEEKKVVNRETVQKIREMFGANIRYLEYEPETEKYGGDIARKWGDAVQHVETEYSQIVTDKEFLIPTTANKCIEYLEQHHDYSGSIGIRYDLEQEGWLNPWSPNTISFEENTILERFKKYNSTEYPDELLLSIQRAEIHKVYYENLANYEIDDIRFGEGCLELQTLIFGKTKRFSDLIGKIRDVTNIRVNKGRKNQEDSSSSRYPSIKDYPPEKLNMSLKKFERCICITLKGYKIDDSTRKEIVKNADDIMMWWFYPEKYRKKNPESRIILFKRYPRLYMLYQCIPERIRRQIASIYWRINRPNNRSDKNNNDITTCIKKIVYNTRQQYLTDSTITNKNKIL